MPSAVLPVTPVSPIRPVDRRVAHPTASACSFRLVFAPSKGREPEEFSAVSRDAALHRVSEQYGFPYPIPVVQFLDRGFLRVEQITPQGPKKVFPLLA